MKSLTCVARERKRERDMKLLFGRFLIEHLRPLRFVRFTYSGITGSGTLQGKAKTLFKRLFLLVLLPPRRDAPAVYVFAATRSTEGASSFTLEMKVLQRRGRKAVRFYWVYRAGAGAILHLLFSRQEPSPTFSLFTRRIPPPPAAVFHSFPFPSRHRPLLSSSTSSSFSAPFRSVPSVNARFLLFARASSKLLSECLRRLARSSSLTHVHSFPSFFLSSPSPALSCPSSFENLDGYRPLLIFTIQGAIFPSFHRAVIKWPLLIVPKVQRRKKILEVNLFLVVRCRTEQDIA